MIDQRKLPASEVYVTCKTANEVAKAIKTMVIRGAPAIGVAAAMGLALGMLRSTATGTKQFTTEFQKLCDLMASTRPTAVNLFWAIERMKKTFADAAQGGCSVDEIKQRLEAEAQKIHDEDVASCRAMGAHGATLVPESARILTHCNAGALATAGYGTALGVIRAAAEAGKRIAVLADETRPFLQGARLTAWELVKDGIDTTVITDNMAGAMMQLGNVDLVVVGADRIAANGDVANKIGTYAVAVLAKEHGLPFYVAAPISTVDLNTPDGTRHPNRGAQRSRGHPRRVVAPDAGRRPHPQSGIRRDAVEVCDRHHHRARDRARTVRRVAGAARERHPRAGGDRGAGAVRLATADLTRCARHRGGALSAQARHRGPDNVRATCACAARSPHDHPRPRDLVRRDGGGGGRGDRRPAAALARAIERRGFADRSAPRMGRGGAGTLGAAACPRYLRRGRTRAGAGRTTCVRGDRRHAGAGSCRLVARRTLLCEVAGLGAARPARRRASPRRSHRVGRARQRRDATCPPSSWSCPAVIRAFIGCHSPARTSCWDGRATMQRGRRMTRWRSCWGSTTRAGPLSTAWPGGGTIVPCAFPKTRLTHADRNAPQLPGRQDFSFSGLKTSVLRYVTTRRVALGSGGGCAVA